MRDDVQTRDALKRLHQLDYLCEPHGAIAWDLLNEAWARRGRCVPLHRPSGQVQGVGGRILNLDVPLPGPLAKHAALPLLSTIAR